MPSPLLMLLAIFCLTIPSGSIVAEALSSDPIESSDFADTSPYRSVLFKTDGSPELSVHTFRGDIDVVYNPGIEGVQVDLYVKRGFSLLPGRRNLDAYRIIMQQDGDRIIASVDERRPVSRNRDDAQFFFVIQVPEKGTFNLRAVNGHVTLDGVNGQHHLQGGSGNVVVRNAEGEIRVATTAGNITLENIKGSVFAKAVSGNITSEKGEGEIRLRTVSGSITASGTTGALVAATTSGDVSTRFSEVSRGVFVETVSGNIDLSMPMNKGYTISAKGLRAQLDELDPDISRVERAAGGVRAEIRQGGLPVQLSSVSGQIRVREN